ncbi:PAS domain-containing methyl-accepting chemotaxis protein [Aurantimonas sp. 22II-16-19i]|uniref:methyl-accepting chemotaxis protein n=1 Tax=Aurantimonas sp. 22II-16-19i TaxID=1317114 RepID=UPI0009F7CEA6|nr:PAS domain-containing methyl-accepting chemotaxis protein [Aurantimonas sp. 22II-16-19i]ORE93961.1 methyl-accepting chemotaxis protein [Aurantimonas sp. 22II-16-19i]
MDFPRQNFGRNATDRTEPAGRTLIVVEYDLQGRAIRANDVFFDRLGVAPAEIRALTHAAFHHADHSASAAYRDYWQGLVAGEPRRAELKRRRAAGDDVWLLVCGHPVRNRLGRVSRITELCHDVTAEKTEFVEMEGKLAAISRFQAVLEFSADGTILDANDNALKLLAYDRSDVVGRHHRELVEPALAASDEYAAFWRKLGRGEFVAGEFRRLAKGGRLVHMQASYNPVVGADGKVLKIVKFATDVTERVEAVAEIGRGLGRLAEGDLSRRIETRFNAELDPIRVDFNRSLDTLEEALARVGETASKVGVATDEIRTASDELAQRTENQAASVEETAAALGELNGTVRSSALNAEEAGKLVERAKAGAEKSGEVVRKAVASMGEIEQSSHKITSIIGVIDEIAFQTNLLALNAGVEAARAGEAGKGFAVVAQEVRELAQRSAAAAREIKDLITVSSAQVADGVALVGDTGTALDVIVTEVQTIDQRVQAIVEAARSQAAGLADISNAIGSIDKSTQHNAAMVEESTAACHNLGQETQRLNDLLAAFQLSEGRAAARTGKVAVGPRPQAQARQARIALVSSQGTASRATVSPARAMIRDVAEAFGATGTKPAAQPFRWEDF